AEGCVGKRRKARLGADTPLDDPGPRHTRLRPCARYRPPRPQAREHHGDPNGGAAECPGTRLRPRRPRAGGAGLVAAAAYGDSRDAWYPLLRRPRAAPRRTRLDPLRPLRLGTHLARVPYRRARPARPVGARGRPQSAQPAARTQPAVNP